LLIKVEYRQKKDVAQKHSIPIHGELFETPEMPDMRTVTKRLTDLKIDFAESTMFITQHEDDAKTAKRKGHKVRKL
jgi:hypothetical protein